MKKDRIIKLEDPKEFENIEYEVLCKEYGEEVKKLIDGDASIGDSLANINPELLKEMYQEFEDTYGKEFDEELDAIIDEVLKEEY